MVSLSSAVSILVAQSDARSQGTRDKMCVPSTLTSLQSPVLEEEGEVRGDEKGGDKGVGQKRPVESIE